MGLDPNIILASRETPQFDPIAASQKALALRQAQMQVQTQQRLRDLATKNDITTPEGQDAILKGYGVMDPIGAMGAMQKRALGAQELAKAGYNTQEAQIAAQKAQLDRVHAFSESQSGIMLAAKQALANVPPGSPQEQQIFGQLNDSLTKNAQQAGFYDPAHPAAQHPIGDRQTLDYKLNETMGLKNQMDMMKAQQTPKFTGPAGELLSVNQAEKSGQLSPADAAALRAKIKHFGPAAGGGNPMGIPGAPVPVSATPNPSGGLNPDALSTLPPNQAGIVKAIAEGRMEVPKGYALKSPYWQGIMQAVSQYDPSFDNADAGARAATRKKFTSGQEAGQVNALNTVIGHMGDLMDAGDKLNNGNFTLFNSIGNAINKATGDPTITRFNAIKNSVAAEIVKVWRGTGGSEADIQERLKDLDASQSPAQLHANLSALTGLLNSKLEALTDQYRQGMGTVGQGLNLITPAASRTLNRIRGAAGDQPIDTSAGRVAGPLTPSQPKTRVNPANGKTYYLHTDGKYYLTQSE